jgi:ribosomal protein S15P/S13E
MLFNVYRRYRRKSVVNGSNIDVDINHLLPRIVYTCHIIVHRQDHRNQKYHQLRLHCSFELAILSE